MTHDTWHMTHDTWHMKHETWNMKHETWNMTHDTWHMTHDTHSSPCSAQCKQSQCGSHLFQCDSGDQCVSNTRVGQCYIIMFFFFYKCQVKCSFMPSVMSCNVWGLFVKETKTIPKGRVEKLSPKESPKDAHTVLRGAPRRTVWAFKGLCEKQFFLTALRIFHSCLEYQNCDKSANFKQPLRTVSRLTLPFQTVWGL